MRVCQMGWEKVQIVGEEGEVHPCCWANYGSMGKLSEQTMQEIWNGERANEFRQSLLDGSYRFCKTQNCKYIANGVL